MKTAEIIGKLTVEQKKACRKSFGDALNIIDEIIGDIPYYSLFNITADIIERLG